MFQLTITCINKAVPNPLKRDGCSSVKNEAVVPVLFTSSPKVLQCKVGWPCHIKCHEEAKALPEHFGMERVWWALTSLLPALWRLCFLVDIPTNRSHEKGCNNNRYCHWNIWPPWSCIVAPKYHIIIVWNTFGEWIPPQIAKQSEINAYYDSANETKVFCESYQQMQTQVQL